MIKKILTNKELFWTFLYQLITLVGGLVLIKLLATTLSKETYGHYSLVTSITALIVMLPFSALMQGVSRYISIYQNKFKYSEFFTIVILLTGILAQTGHSCLPLLVRYYLVISPQKVIHSYNY